MQIDCRAAEAAAEAGNSLLVQKYAELGSLSSGQPASEGRICDPTGELLISSYQVANARISRTRTKVEVAAMQESTTKAFWPVSRIDIQNSQTLRTLNPAPLIQPKLSRG